MTSSSDALLDHHIADYLQFMSNSNAQMFWFTLNMSMKHDHGCHLAS